VKAMSPLLDPFIRGLGAGGMAAFTLAVLRSRTSAQAKWVTVGLGVSVVCWMISESASMWTALGHVWLLQPLGFLASGAFWLFVQIVFEDRPVRPWVLLPAVVLLSLGLSTTVLPWRESNLAGAAFNSFSGLLAIHAAFVVARGWRGDLIEGRRRARAVLLGLVVLFVMIEVILSLAAKVDPARGWLRFAVGGPYGAAILAVLIFATVAVFLEARATLFDPPRRAEARLDTRAEVADRQLLGKLESFMADGGWKTEGLTIGAVAQALDTPEHRLRRLINQKLGHRNFADFVNGHRIEAARARLADPAEAGTTVAAIAFDLGYGSLGPFNRAFRAATGATPTEWRRQALAEASPILEEAI